MASNTSDTLAKTVIITGASSGIGRATACRFAEAGARVVINHWQDEDGAEQTRELCAEKGPNAEALIVEADMGAPEGPDHLFRSALDHFGRVDTVINNAAIKRPQDPVSYDLEDFDAVLTVNLKGPFKLAQIAIQHFQASDQSGSVLCVSSIHDQTPLPSDIGYSMSKAALFMMVKALAKSASGGKIRVNAVSPGAILTPMNKHWIADQSAVDRFAQTNPMRRAGVPQDIASALFFLASDEASYITGQTIYVDGGMTL